MSEISRRLNAEGVCGVHGKASWFPVTIERVLRNEKHVGDLLMQKTYTSDYLTKKQTENNGELEQYHVKDDHPGIIRREEWDAVQLELERREAFRERHGIHTAGSSNDDPLYSRVFCGTCGGKLVRKNWKGNRQPFWKCENAEKKKGHTCKAENVKEANLKQAIVIAWNSLVEKRSEKVAEWQQLAVAGNALERYRARLMLAVTEDGPLETEVPELTRMFLEEIVVHTPTEMTVGFLNESRVKVRL